MTVSCMCIKTVFSFIAFLKAIEGDFTTNVIHFTFGGFENELKWSRISAAWGINVEPGEGKLHFCMKLSPEPPATISLTNDNCQRKKELFYVQKQEIEKEFAMNQSFGVILCSKMSGLSNAKIVMFASQIGGIVDKPVKRIAGRNPQ
ncbi:hypothetical protein BDZ97DRAFT_1754788 [Flammula alnicola]|nr:hypothetical protein BDZ97DRAFT_1754788 [Flammula alnicola]